MDSQSMKKDIKTCISGSVKTFIAAMSLISGFSGAAFALAPPPGGTGGESPGGGLLGFLPLILIFVVFYFLLIRPQSKKAKEHKQMLDDLKKGDKVITTGGMYGLVEDLDADTVTLKIGVKDDVRVKVGRPYIASLRTGE